MRRTIQVSSAARRDGLPADPDNLEVANSGESLVGANGEYNANSRKELIETVASVISAIDEHGHGSRTVEQAQAEREQARVNRELVLAAFDDTEELAALGDRMAEALYIAMNRDGFMRRLTGYQSLEEGEKPSVDFDLKNVTAGIVTGTNEMRPQMIREQEFYPKEFYIQASPFIDQIELSRHGGDMLKRVYNNALTATMVAEDRVWKEAADKLVNIDNEFQNIAGAMTPTNLSAAAALISRWGIPPKTALWASNVWQDLTGSAAASWSDVFDQVTKHNVLMTGKLGMVYGMTIISDHYRHQQHKVLDAGDFYIVGDTDQHGQYTDRGGLVSEPVTVAETGRPGRGWNMYETLSLIIVNARSVAKGRRST